MKELNLLHIVLIYLAVINVVTFFVYGIDKWKAKKSKWRIRETALLGLAIPRYACWPLKKGVEVRLIHAKEPGTAWRGYFKSLPPEKQ